MQTGARCHVRPHASPTLHLNRGVEYGLVFGLVARVHRKIGQLVGGKTMTCPTCSGNGYVRQADGEIAQCETCDSQGEIKGSKDAKTDEN